MTLSNFLSVQEGLLEYALIQMTLVTSHREIIAAFNARLIFQIIIPHVNSPYKTSIDERLIFYNITRCYSDGEYCHAFAIAAGDIIKYQGCHMMRNADARTVRSRQETFNSIGGHET